MRLFFAVTLLPEMIARIGEAQERFRELADDPGLRLTRAEQFHFTIKFLGETQPIRMQRAIGAAIAVREGAQRFEIRIGGVGAFPNSQRPSTVWIGSGGAAETGPLAGLAAELDGALANQGFRKEARPLTPHITLARVKTYAAETAAARALRKLKEDDSLADLGAVAVDGFTLYQSTLRPQGSEYEIIEEFKFAG